MPNPTLPPSNLLRAFRFLARDFRREPLAVRIHVLGRFLTAPFLRLLRALPEEARLLDLGAGHGAFSHLAAEYRNARCIAVEPDLRKVLAAPRRPGVLQVVGYSRCVRGSFDAIAILDVLYRIPVADWDAILGDARTNLRPGGLLLLKEIDPEDRLKGAWNRAQEKVADLLGMTLGDAFSYETQAQMTDRLARLGFERIEAVPLGAGYPHAHVLYRARTQSSPAGPAT